jgi:hypothetical protein
MACGGEMADLAQDTADVPVGTPLEIDAEPRIVVGVVDGDPAQEFTDVVTPFLMGDSLLVVPTRGHREIRLFDNSGEFVGSYGGVGEGPGEFIQLGGAWFRGDTIEVFDIGLQRVTRFPPGGVPEVTTLQGAYVMWGVGELSGNWLLVNLARPGLTRENPRDEWAIHYFGRSGEHVASLGRVQGIRRFMIGGTIATDPFSPSARFVVHGDEIYVGDTFTPEVRVLDTDGRQLRTIVLNEEDAIEPSEALARLRARLEDLLPLSDDAAQRLNAAPPPEGIPYFTDVLVDQEGFVWVRPYVPERDATTVGGRPDVHVNNAGGEWHVYSAEGARVATVLMPEDLAPYQITSTAVVGVARNDLDVEAVRVHPLVRR